MAEWLVQICGGSRSADLQAFLSSADSALCAITGAGAITASAKVAGSAKTSGKILAGLLS